MQLAYLILAHRYPDHLIRLIRRLEAPHASFFIHLDLKMDNREVEAVHTALLHTPRVHFVRRQACHWAGFSIVQATFAGLEHALSVMPDLDYLVLLSGQDYPIKTNEQILSFFREANGRSFVHHNPFPYSAWEWYNGGWDRIQQWYIRTPKRFYVLPGTNLFPWHRVNRLWNRVVRANPFKRRFPKGLTPYGGAQFWAMHRTAAEYVRDYVHSRPDLFSFFRYVFASDEIFFQTIIGNWTSRNQVTSDTLHFLEWQRPGAVLNSNDMASLKNTWFLFARKFDANVDAGVMDRIDRELLGLKNEHRPSV